MSSTLVRQDLPIDALHPHPDNPNTMTKKGFNLLVDNMARVGITDPVLVRPLAEGGYRIVGGHHRVEGAKVLGYTEVPCTIITDPDFNEDEEAFQLMRHNMIKGKLSPEKFVGLYEKLASKYSNEVLFEAFGFEEQAELEKLIKQTAKELPKEMKAEFEEAAKEVKTIKDLSALLNRLFSAHGDTLPFGYMFMDFGGKESVWLRMMSHDLKNFEKVAFRMKEKGKTVDGLMRVVLHLIANQEMPEVEAMLSSLPDVKVPEEMAIPTEDALSILPE